MFFLFCFLTWLNFKIISRNWLAFSHETHNVDVPPCFNSKAVQWCFNEPLTFTVHSNGPVLSWLTVPLMVHVVNAFLLDEQPRIICDISFVFRSEALSLSVSFPRFTLQPCCPSPPTLLAFIFFLLWGVILTDITTRPGQMLKLKYAIHQPTDSSRSIDRGDDPGKTLLVYKAHTLTAFTHKLSSHPAHLNQDISGVGNCPISGSENGLLRA